MPRLPHVQTYKRKALAKNYTHCKLWRNFAAVGRDAAHAVVYRAYAIRPCKWRKTNTAKITFDAGKTMSYVEKIISDIIQTTSDLFSPVANT